MDYSILMGQRLRELRKARKLSMADLRNALRNKYGVSISVNTIGSYEVDSKYHSQYERNQRMGVKMLRCLADFYGVSTDWIMGLTNADDN